MALGRKKTNGEITHDLDEYLKDWHVYIDFLESVGIVVHAFDPDFRCYWKTDVRDNVICGNSFEITMDLVKLMMTLKGDTK